MACRSPYCGTWKANCDCEWEDEDEYWERKQAQDPDFQSLAETDPGEVNDPRDLTPEPPAYLDPMSVLRMRAMVKDAAENGDRDWPYGRTA